MKYVKKRLFQILNFYYIGNEKTTIHYFPYPDYFHLLHLYKKKKHVSTHFRPRELTETPTVLF